MSKKMSSKLHDLIVKKDLIKAGTALDELIASKNLELNSFTPIGKDLMEVGRFELAAKVFAKWAEMEPENFMPWSNLGACLHKMRLNEDAKEILLHAIRLNPDNAFARINLGGVLQELRDYKAGIENALEAVRCDPTSSLAFNNLGSAFADSGMHQHAQHAFETSLMLDKKSQFARINLAKINSILGNTAIAIEQFEEALKIEEKNKGLQADVLKAHLAFDYLKMGRIEDGWRCYEYGFSPYLPLVMSRQPQRIFSVPKWGGQSLKSGQRLMIWREQGVGDEILFGTCLHELKNIGGQIIVECDPRLLNAYRRSFPEFEIRAEPLSVTTDLVQKNHDFDFHLPVGSLSRFFRKSLSDYQRGGPFIEVDQEQKLNFRERLAGTEGKLKIGFAWRSGMLSANRNAAYTSLIDWNDIFSIPNAVFVNLQYGDCEQELVEAEKLHGIQIHRWPDLDLKFDLDRTFALMSCLDVVVSAAIAVFPMAGAVGVKAVQLGAPYWANFGSASAYPWFPGARITGMVGSDMPAKDLKKVPGLIMEMLDIKF